MPPPALKELLQALRNPTVAGIVCAGAILSVVGAIGLRQFENRQLRIHFATAAERRARAVRRQIDGDLAALTALRGFMEVRYPLTASDFDNFAARLLESHPSILAAEWVSRVQGGKQRQDFESELRHTAPDLTITEGTPQSNRVAAQRADYYPVRFMYPLNQANRPALGFDLGSCGACRRALETSAATNQPITMGRLKILEREGYGVLVVLPAYRAGKNTAPTDFALVLLEVAGLVEQALQPVDPEGIGLILEDASAPAANRLLYTHKPRLHAAAPTASLPPYEQTISVGSRTWKLTFIPNAVYAAGARTWWPWITLLAGMLFTLATAVHFHSEIMHAQQSGKFVKDLRAANARLSEEIETRKKAEEALRTSEAEYRLLFEGNTQPMWVCDLPGLGILAANAAAQTHYGYSEEELRSLTLFDLGVREDRERLLERTRAAFTTTGQERPWRHRKKDGTPIIVEITGNPIRFRDHNACLILAHDITRRLEMEERARQNQRLETVGRLAGGIAHDFNNLLTVVNGYSDMILSDAGYENKIGVRVSQIRSAGQRAAELTQQLLAFSRGQIVQPKVLNLNDTVTDMSRMLRRVIGEDIVFTLKLSSDSGNIVADEGQISQILMNLAVNARDAMPEGGTLTMGTSRVSFNENCKALQPDSEPGDHVCLWAADTGSGITPEIIGRIFEPFFTTKAVGKGTGLGLSTVYGMVKQQGGWISVESEPGHGATFSIYWPRTENQVPPRDFSSRPDVTGSETVLVVEDQDEVRKLAVSALQRYGYTVYHASTPEGALEFVNSFPGSLDLVLSDVVMPQMSGPELAAKILKISPAVRVLFMSGYYNEAPGMDNIGDARYLPKPFTAEGLAAAARRTLDAASASHTANA